MSDNNPENVYRNGAPEHTQILNSEAVREAEAAAAQAQADEAASQRAQEKAARDRSLGKVSASEAVVASGPVIHKHTNDRFAGSLGLFLLRLVTAGIMAVHGYQKLTDITGTEGFFTKVGVPSPYYAAWGAGVAGMLAGVALLFGILVRVAGLGVAAISILALVMVKWGSVNPFQSGVPGFTGELELLLAAVGLTFFFLGGGRWGIDGQWRANRRKAKAQR